MSQTGGEVVLASASRARASLLGGAGVRFTIDRAAVDEAGVRAALRSDGTGAADAVLSFEPSDERFTVYPLPTRGALIRHIDVDEVTGDVWAAYSASPGIPTKILRIQSR